MFQLDTKAYQPLSPIGQLSRLIRDPANFLTDSKLTEKQLSDTLALVWRLYILIKLGELFPWQSKSLHVGILVCVFLFARPLANLVLRANVPFLNGAVRLAGGRSDRAAAFRALTCCFILPNPLLGAYVFSPLIARYFGPVVATFVLYGLCGVVTAFLDGLATHKAYGLTRRQGIVLVVSSSILAGFMYFQIPFYLSDRFSPKVVAGNADLTLLEFRPLPVDSSVDGSEWLERILQNPLPFDTTEIMHAIKQGVAFKRDLPDRVESVYRGMAPLRAITWIDKRKLATQVPDDQLLGDSAIVSTEYSEKLIHYLSIAELRFSICLKQGRFDAADSTLNETLRALTALGHANMGLVYPVVQSEYTRKMLNRISQYFPGIHDPKVLRQLAATVAKYPIDTEALLNALRQQSYQFENIYRKSGKEAYANWVGKFSVYGVAFPDYTYRKFFDTVETLEINRHLWAKMIAVAKSPPRDDGPPTFEERRLQYSMNAFTATILKNSIGRIVVGFSIPLYTGFARAVRDNRRYAEAMNVSLQLRAYYLENKRPLSSDEFPQSEFTSGFTLRNDSLFSVDSAHSKKIFSIVWK